LALTAFLVVVLAGALAGAVAFAGALTGALFGAGAVADSFLREIKRLNTFFLDI